MARRTLLDFFTDVTSDPAARDSPFLAYDDGYRIWTWTYAELAADAAAFGERLRAEGIASGQTVAIWSENRPEWIAALWGAVLEGVVLVPIDYRASAEFLLKVAGLVEARVVLVGDVVDPEPLGSERPIWPLSGVVRRASPDGPLRPETDHPIPDPWPTPAIGPDTTAEIIFTSGATAEPKGVVLTHRNILANIVPIEREVHKYRKWAWPFRPIRFLNLLPLSHMFGQAMATFVPPMLPGFVLFTRSYAPDDIVQQIRDRRVSVLVCVPKILEVLQDHVLRVIPEAAQAPPAGMHWMSRWWRYRRVHRLFGFKFWAMVVGGAPLDPELEAFWGRLGFVVVQGYGLTETAPIVTLNHPFHARRGAVGAPIAGVEVRIAPDGEILVRGENVTRGYYKAPDETRTAFEDGWFHTGDIGEFDDKGQLHIRGRKKEMIVTPEGLNVFPEDVERALNDQAGVRDSAVIGAPVSGGGTAERVQAILVLEPGANADAIVRSANLQLADAQKIRAAAVWPGPELPRTEGTRKLKRRELRAWVMGQRPASGPAARDGHPSVEAILARFAPGRTIEPSTTIDELGLSSLERVELMMALEEALQITVDEVAFSEAKTVADLERLAGPETSPGAEPGQTGHKDASDSGQAGPHPGAGRPETSTARHAREISFPFWNRWGPARLLRRVSLPTWILPLGRLFAVVQVDGLEHLTNLTGPVIFAANHQSHLDTPVILDSLPGRWRYRVAPAMAREFFAAHFFPERYSRKAWLTNSLNYYLAALFFNAFPLTQGGTGTRQTLRYIGELVADGVSILIYPEGQRTEEGGIARFRPGVGMIASRMAVPVVPVRLEGLDRILGRADYFPTRGRARCAFGAPMSLSGNDYAALASQVEAAVRAL